MSDPFRYTDAKVTCGDVDFNCATVRLTITSVEPPRDESGIDSSGYALSGDVSTWAPVEIYMSAGAVIDKREYNEITAHIDQQVNPLSIPTAQELVMRQHLGEFD